MLEWRARARGQAREMNEKSSSLFTSWLHLKHNSTSPSLRRHLMFEFRSNYFRSAISLSVYVAAFLPYTRAAHTTLQRGEKKVAAAEEKTFSAAGVVAAAAIVCWDSEKKMLSVLLLSWIFPTELFLLLPPSSSPLTLNLHENVRLKSF